MTRSLLRLDDKLAAQEAHLRALGRGDQPGRLLAAIVLSLAAHTAFAMLPAPRAAAAGPPPPPPRAALPEVVRWIPAAPEPAPVAPPPPVAAGTAAPASSPGAVADRAVTVHPASPASPALGLDVFTESEPVAEPPPRVAVSLPRDVETMIGTPSPPPPAAKPVWRAGPAATRPVVALGGRVDPDYPPAARALRLTGSVLLDVEVNEDGTVGAVNIVGVTRRGVGFEAAAAAAVKQWRFVPGTQDGRPVTTTTSVEVTFQ